MTQSHLQSYSQQTVLVTGAAGFIGSHLVERLLNLGARVVGVDNLITGSTANIEAVITASTPTPDQFTFIKADVNRPPESYLPQGVMPDIIFHLASPASPNLYQKYPRETYLVNTWATHQLLDYLLTVNANGKFLFASTSEIYGDPDVHPQPESYWGNVNPNGPRSCYDESKRMGESICGVYARDFALDVRIARIFNTYGPRMDINDGRVVPNFIKFALAQQKLPVHGDGQQTRAYCYVDDLVEGLLRLASFPGLKGETINLGNPGEYTVIETAKLILQAVHGSVTEADLVFKPLPQDDPTRRRPDITKANQLLDWQPSIEFAEGLKKTVEYFLKETVISGA
jgi:nucleoside-diphosphate-sugar epimerase